MRLIDLPHNKKIHLIGACGIGMSALACLLKNKGYIISGSDIRASTSSITSRLFQLGIEVNDGHNITSIKEADAIIYSSAINLDNPEMLYALHNKIPSWSRAQVLGEILEEQNSLVVGGTHGKTTTTALIGYALRSKSPTIIAGGILENYNSNVSIGTSNVVVAEADESDGSMGYLRGSISIITNIEMEHIDFYEDTQSLLDDFKKFAHNASYGVVICKDDFNCREILLKESFTTKILTYGLCKDYEPDLLGVNVRFNKDGALFDVDIKGADGLQNVHLPVFGLHNVLNALGALASTVMLRGANSLSNNMFQDFKGVRKRFSVLRNSKSSLIISDYAHHPTEISCFFDQYKIYTSFMNLKDRQEKTLLVFEPHRLTRFNYFFEAFADNVSNFSNIAVTPVYDKDIQKCTELSKKFVNKLNNSNKNINSYFVSSLVDIKKLIDEKGFKYILFIGAGLAHYNAKILNNTA